MLVSGQDEEDAEDIADPGQGVQEVYFSENDMNLPS
jgi:hypothetical protein